MILAICQINSKVDAYTWDEVKEITEYKTVEENGEPQNYDILIDAKDLIDYEKIPCMKTTLDKVLYSDYRFI